MILKLILSGLADRFRGNGGIFEYRGRVFDTPRIITLLLMGYSVSAIYGVYWGVEALILSLCIGGGFSFGWGMPLGSALQGITQQENILRNPKYKYEWWQFGELEEKAYLALGFRGLMVGLPLAFAGLYSAIFYKLAIITAVSYAISMPLSVAIVVTLKSRLKDTWGAQEYIRAPIAGLISILIMGSGLWVFH